MGQENKSCNYRWLAYGECEPEPRQSMGMSEMLLGNGKNSLRIRIAGHVRGGRRKLTRPVRGQAPEAVRHPGPAGT